MTDELTDRSVEAFLDELASSSSTPGGGSVAALSGALGAALISMVCKLTLGRKRYASVEKEMAHFLEEAEQHRHALAALLTADARAYAQVSRAMKMPRESEDESAARASALQTALKGATEVPLRVAETCAAVMELCRPVAEKGNVNAVSDAGVAMLVAEAGLRSASLNVLINLAWIEDEVFVAEQRSALDGLLEGKPEVREDVYQLVLSKL
jgi:formiminotetrahydrofolate cyclodeaminase